MSDQNVTAVVAGTHLENRYVIHALLGQGGMSRVYLADAIQLGTRVAIKENLQMTEEARNQFEREARLLASLAHPHIPRVLDHFVDHATGRQYLVMDYIEGENLETIIERAGPLPERTALVWIGQILGALEYLHAQTPPIIHRDVKPSNIKITPQGKAVLVDFGISKVYDPRLTLTGSRAVTPGYAPPEQYGMRTSERSDIYAVGATLYTMLTGVVPTEAPLRQAGELLVPPGQIRPGQVSPFLDRIIMRTMELETQKRWLDVKSLRVALAEQRLPTSFIEHPTVALPQAAARATISLPVMMLVGASGLGIVLLIVGLVLMGILGPAPAGAGIATPPTNTPTTRATAASSTFTPTALALTPTLTQTSTRTLVPTPTSARTATPTPTKTLTPTPGQTGTHETGAQNEKEVGEKQKETHAVIK